MRLHNVYYAFTKPLERTCISFKPKLFGVWRMIKPRKGWITGTVERKQWQKEGSASPGNSGYISTWIAISRSLI